MLLVMHLERWRRPVSGKSKRRARMKRGGRGRVGKRRRESWEEEGE